MKINDSVVLLTGATGGIGQAIAAQLAALGARLVIAARSPKELRELEAQLPGSFAVPADVINPQETQRLVEQSLDRHGRIDVLINCAAQAMFAAVERIPLDQYRSLIELNLVAPLHLMQRVIPTMRSQGGGTIINISSQSSRKNIPNIAGYASTKSALNMLSLTARAELAKDRITVSVILPGIVDSDFGVNTPLPEPDRLRRSPTGEVLPHVISPAKVAEKVAELIQSGEAELDLVTP